MNLNEKRFHYHVFGKIFSSKTDSIVWTYRKPITMQYNNLIRTAYFGFLLIKLIFLFITIAL